MTEQHTHVVPYAHEDGTEHTHQHVHQSGLEDVHSHTHG
jgi:hypothetical protein